MSSEDKTSKAAEAGHPETPVSRRDFLKTAGVTGLALGATGGLGGVLAACGGERRRRRRQRAVKAARSRSASCRR